jgi:RHS repeat-associated protein
VVAFWVRTDTQLEPGINQMNWFLGTMSKGKQMHIILFSPLQFTEELQLLLLKSVIRKNKETMSFIRLLICIVILGAASLPQAAKRFSVGPTADWDYSTINDALAAQVPFTEDVILEVYMDPSGYNTKGIVEYSHLFGGYSLYITVVADFPKAATYYVNDELEYEVPQSKTGVCRTTEYIKGADIVARRVTQGASTSGNQFYVKNHLGSTMFLTNAAATTNIAEADYFPYGKKIDLTTTPDHVTQTFTGKELDRYDESMGEGEDGEGWYYFGARYYDVDIGKWISTDPKKEFYDYYRYCVNPIGHFDPNGENDVATIWKQGYLVLGIMQVRKESFSATFALRSEMKLPESYDPVDNNLDAFRHAYLAIALFRKFKGDYGRTLDVLWEHENISNNKSYEMDMHNNIIGLMAASNPKNKDIPTYDLAKNLLNEGKLQETPDGKQKPVFFHDANLQKNEKK